MVKIVLDAGHGGSDPGAVYEGRQEKDDNLQLVFDVGAVLESNGIDVEYTRVTDVYQSPYEKAAMANQSGADYFVSIHRNARDVPNTEGGVETLLYSTEDSVKKDMAEAINRNLEAIGFTNRGVIARPNLVVLRDTDMPALLVEAGFIDSEADNMLYDANQAAIADAIAFGILAGLAEAATYAAEEQQAAENRYVSAGEHAVEKQYMSGEQFAAGNRYMTEEQPTAEKRYMPEEQYTSEKPYTAEEKYASEKQHVAEEQRAAEKQHTSEEQYTSEKPHAVKEQGEEHGDEKREFIRSDREYGDDEENRREYRNINEVGKENPGNGNQKNGRKTWRVQVGVYRNPSNARVMLNRLARRGHQVCMIYRNGLYYIQAGAYPDLPSAVAEERRLKAAGLQTVIVTDKG